MTHHCFPPLCSLAYFDSCQRKDECIEVVHLRGHYTLSWPSLICVCFVAELSFTQVNFWQILDIVFCCALSIKILQFIIFFFEKPAFIFNLIVMMSTLLKSGTLYLFNHISFFPVFVLFMHSNPSFFLFTRVCVCGCVVCGVCLNKLKCERKFIGASILTCQWGVCFLGYPAEASQFQIIHTWWDD